MTDGEKFKKNENETWTKIQMIQNLIFVILFLKISFPHVPVDIISFFIPEFVAENLKANKNQRKRSLILQNSFAQKTSLILQISTLLKLKITFS